MKYNKDTFKLDNSAIVYPLAKTKKWTAMFRISITLKEDIDINILKQALTVSLKRMPAFSTTLKKGFLWHYLKKIDGLPPIEKDVKYPMESLDIAKNNGFLFRVRYDANKLSFEYFHSLTDGHGGLTFLLTTVNEYLSIKYGKDLSTNKNILDCNDSFDSTEYIDDYHTFATKGNNKYQDAICYYPKGQELENGKIAITTAEIKTDVLKNVANNYKVTIGGLLTSLMIYSFYVAQKSEKKFLPIKVAVPVNLRYFYPSKTLSNFTTFITPGIINSKNNYEFNDVVNIVKQYLKDNVKEEKVNRQFSKMVALEKNPFIHIIPLFIKNPIMRYIYLRQNRYFSSTFSNLGNVILPDEMSNYVSKVDFMLGQASIPKSIGSCVSYNNKTIINISRTVKENKIEKVFFETLEKIGVMSNVKEN